MLKNREKTVKNMNRISRNVEKPGKKDKNMEISSKILKNRKKTVKNIEKS